MDILIRKGDIINKGVSFKTTLYTIYSTTKLPESNIRALIRSIDAGQDITIKEKNINGKTTILYKFLYNIELSCDSSD